MAVNTAFFPVGGGMDLVTPAVAKSAGTVIAALNYEPTARGYRRFIGFERFDGRTAPSSSTVPATIATLRAAITAVPGSGPVRAVIPIKTYTGTWEAWAIRDNLAGTAAVIYDQTSGGWAVTTPTKSARFDQGGIDGRELDLDNFYDKTSGAGGTNQYPAYRWTVESGSWATGDASGTVWMPGNVDFASGDYLYRSDFETSLRVIRIASTPTSPTIPAGGEWRSISHNFYGASNLTKTYLVNGVGKALEIGYNGAGPAVNLITIGEISTGMDVDTPTHIAVHKNSLFLGFPGGSLQFSQPGEPLVFDPVVGAGELGIGDEIADLVTVPNALAILGENSIHMLYGSDSSDYMLETLTRDAGALPNTAQRFGQVYYMDNRGVRTLNTTQSFGNFSTGTVSRAIQPLLEDKRRDDIDPVATLVSRTAEQYWVFFSDGTGIVGYMGRKQPEFMPFDLGVTVSCTATIEDDGEERLFIGCTNGFVYELNKGTSFDGAAIEHYVRFPFNHFGSPQNNKQWGKVLVDMVASGTTSVFIDADFDFGSVVGLDPQQITVTTGGGAMDDLGSNELYYASQIETVGTVYISGVARNLAIKIGGETSAEQAHTITGVTITYELGGMVG